MQQSAAHYEKAEKKKNSSLEGLQTLTPTNFSASASYNSTFPYPLPPSIP